MKKTLFFLAALMTVMMASAQSWNFKTISDGDVALMNAATNQWYHETGSNDRYHLLTAVKNESLKVDGNELEITKGLLFTVTASTSTTQGNLRVDIKNMRLWVAGSDTIVIPNVAAGKQVTVIAKTSAGSSSTDKERGVNVSANVKPLTGKFNQVSADQVTNVGVVEQEGDVMLTFSGAMYLYELSVSDADDDEEGNDDPTPTPVPSINDYSTSANAMMNQVIINTQKYGNRYYNTSSVSSIDINEGQIVVNQAAGNYTFNEGVTSISFKKATTDNQGTIVNVEGQVQITEARGWFESAYVKFAFFENATKYNVYVKGGSYADYTKIDEQLVRNYGTYGRADVLGLKAGSDYCIKVVPVISDREVATAASEATAINVAAYDRSGFAHMNRTEGVGAYNNDGTLKANANVVYITKDNAKTVSLSIATNSKGGSATYTGFQQIIYGYQKGYESRPLDIRIIGTISAADCDEFLSSSEGIQIKGAKAYMPINITIEGVGEDATTTGFGFLLRSVSSVELRNFANMLCMDDAVSIDTDNSNIWVHNLDLFYGNTGGDADQAKGDGTIDMKGDSKYLTVSYNHLWDSGKASLCGMKSESGPNWITYHHNWFDHSDSRHPRIRTMSVHVWNNYYDGNAKYGVGAAYKSNAFVEANYFRNCKYPMLISLQGSDIATNPKGTFSGEDGGMIKSFANAIYGANAFVTYQQNATQFDAYEAKTRDEIVPATVTALQGGRVFDNWDVDPALMYTYTPDAAQDVPSIVTGWLGAGRMAHGDFQWIFDNSVEDANYNVIAPLKKALQDYKTTLVGLFGQASTPSGEQGGEQPSVTPGDTTQVVPTPTPEGTILCTFDKSGKASNSFFTVSGNGSNSKGSATIDGKEYTECLKMEKATSIKFTLTKTMKMTLYFGNTETASVKINGSSITGSGNTYVQTLASGEYELMRDKSVNLFGIKLEPVTE
jgi:pectate lyase